MDSTTMIATIAVLGHLGCWEKYLDDVIAELDGKPMPDTPTAIFRHLKQAMTDIGLTPYSDGWHRVEDHEYRLERMS